MSRTAFLFALLSGVAIFSSSAGAASPVTDKAAAVEALEQRLQALEQELALVKRQQEVDKEITTSNAQRFATVEMNNKGLLVTSPDKNYTLKVRGFVQADARQFLNDENSTGKDDFLIRRARPIFEFTAGKGLFRLMPDFGGSTTRLQDAYADYTFNDFAKVRFGKFKPSIGIENNQSDTDNHFIERGFPSGLMPSRDIALQLYGARADGVFEYQLAIANGAQDGANSDTDEDDKKDLVARIFTSPFKSSDSVWLRGLGYGVGGSIGDREGAPTRTILGDYRSPGQQAIFRYRSGAAAADTTYAEGTHWRYSPQLSWYYNNVGLLVEYALSSQEVRRGATSDQLVHQAWQLTGSWVVTGEDSVFKDSVKPERPFNPAKNQWGAVELTGRVGELLLDDESFPVYADASQSANSAFSAGLGANWFWNENLKLALNYDHTRFDGGAAAGNDRPDEHALFARAQVRF